MRDTGMRAIGCIVPLPADSTVSIRSPSSVPVRMCAVVSDPSRMLPFIANVTSASPWRSDTSDTVPTFIPDTVTGLPVARPPASVNSAWYRTIVAHEMNRSGDRPTRMTITDQDDADESGLDEPSSAILEHQGSVHLPASDLKYGSSHRLALKIRAAERQLAQVVGDGGAVHAESDQLAVVLRRLLRLRRRGGPCRYREWAPADSTGLWCRTAAAARCSAGPPARRFPCPGRRWRSRWCRGRPTAR